MRTISLALEYFHPWPNSAGFYVARERGWYSEAGIDLELRTVDPGRGDTLGYLARGEVDLGIFPTNRLLVRREAGQDLIAVAAINQRGLETVRARADSGISRLRDLEGKRIAYNPTPRGRAIVRSLIAGDGGDPDNYVTVDAGARELDPANGFDGIADATFGSYWAWDNLLTSYPAESEVVWRVDEVLGVGYHSYLLGGRRGALDDGLLASLLDVSARGFLAAAEDQEAAAAIYDRVTPYFPPRVIRTSLEAIAPDLVPRGGVGASCARSSWGPTPAGLRRRASFGTPCRGQLRSPGWAPMSAPARCWHDLALRLAVHRAVHLGARARRRPRRERTPRRLRREPSSCTPRSSTATTGASPDIRAGSRGTSPARGTST
ncbi:MAG: ABC transporter substrate-binding protein [Galbitalea sp.]